jgi:hypothetical protein
MLVEALGSKDSSLRSAAAMALSCIADKESPWYGGDSNSTETKVTETDQIIASLAVPALIDALRDSIGEHLGSQREIAKALQKIGDVRAVPALAELIRDEGARGEMRNIVDAIWALGDIGDVSAVPALVDVLSFDIPHRQDYVCEALSKISGGSSLLGKILLSRKMGLPAKTSALLRLPRASLALAAFRKSQAAASARKPPPS